MNQAPPASLLAAFILYGQTKKTTSGKKNLSNLKTVFRKYLLAELPGYSFHTSMLDKQNLEICLSKVSIPSFINAEPLAIFNQLCDRAVSNKQIQQEVVRTTYQPALTGFIRWIQKQTWHNNSSNVKEQKYAPKLRPTISLATTKRGLRSHKANPYSIQKEELPSTTLRDLEALHQFCTAKEVPDRQDPLLREVSFQDNVQRSALLFFGWLHHIQGWHLENLTLDLMLTDGNNPPAENLRLLKEFIAWGINTRGNSYGWGMMITKASLNIAKWKYACQSEHFKYGDIDIIKKLRLYINGLSEKYGVSKSITSRDKKNKDMLFSQCVEVVQFLRQCCAPYKNNHCKRSDMAVTRSWQRYLIVAFLTYCPLRQREFRELELNRTLFRDDGYRVILTPLDNKTGDYRDFRLVDLLPPEVIADLDQWLDYWRPKFIDSVKADAETPESWLKSLGYKQEELEQETQDLLLVIREKEPLGKSKELDKLRKQLKRHQKLLSSWEKVQAALSHDYVFLQLGGTTAPENKGTSITAGNFRGLVTKAVYNSTSALIESRHPLFEGMEPKCTNPHFFRNIAITHERRNGDPARREAFHKVIGNSVAEGDRTYNEMSPAEKTAQASGWWEPSAHQGISLGQIKELLGNLSPDERLALLGNNN